MPSKLDKRDIQDIFDLTPMQEGMLFHYLREPGSKFYFEQLSLEISGEIDIGCFEKAWNFVISMNDMLRAAFHWEKVQNPVQIILNEHKLHPQYYDFSHEQPDDAKKLLVELKKKDRNNQFDLRTVPFRLTLVKVEKEKYHLIISNHHILYDGWSNGIILEEFFSAYHALLRGEMPRKLEKTGFKEYVKKLRHQG
jgi:iturin family lipopeptide synthetase B